MFATASLIRFCFHFSMCLHTHHEQSDTTQSRAQSNTSQTRPQSNSHL